MLERFLTKVIKWQKISSDSRCAAVDITPTTIFEIGSLRFVRKVNLMTLELAKELEAKGAIILSSNMKLGAFNNSSSPSLGRIESSFVLEVSIGCECVINDVWEIVEKLPEGAVGFKAILGAYACCQSKLVTSPFFPAIQEKYLRMASMSTARCCTRPSLGNDVKIKMFAPGTKHLTNTASYDNEEIDETARLIPTNAMPFVEPVPLNFNYECPLQGMSDDECLKLIDINQELSSKNRELIVEFR